MRGSTPRANPLTEGEIGAVLGRVGLLAPDDRLRCVPLDGGVSSDIWRIEIGARRYCLKRALPRLKALASATLATKRALVHGDVSPKNILVGPDGPVFIDSECAWYGEPAFDLAF
ncbi:MAG: phosphotransferase, partial [Pseudolabrys sp.]